MRKIHVWRRLLVCFITCQVALAPTEKYDSPLGSGGALCFSKKNQGVPHKIHKPALTAMITSAARKFFSAESSAWRPYAAPRAMTSRNTWPTLSQPYPRLVSLFRSAAAMLSYFFSEISPAQSFSLALKIGAVLRASNGKAGSQNIVQIL